MATQKSTSKKKGKGTHPSHVAYKSSGRLQDNKLRRIMKHNRIRVDKDAKPRNAKERHALATRPRTRGEAIQLRGK